ncbi:S8 family peptidase [Chryseobacterium turcicum]|uniref:S8 family peptidase n=1 Tax=Chryseobacterium turcicum TaxID=2898076 RepID=A0A9Q3YXU1_9FLAO|nr:S8 family peptidase [Chryseobacterium turcicum]MCD1117567.1 S8 family peptidase [Chryseobacterium turcicum]
MAKRSHLKFISKEQLSEVKDFRYNYGYDGNKEEEDISPKNYFRLATALRANLRTFEHDVSEKYERRDPDITIPADIDYMEITFQDLFEIRKFFSIYYEDYGLEGVAFYDFAKRGLFAIIDRDKFEAFIGDVIGFTRSELDHDNSISYSANIKYIAGFRLLKTEDIVRFQLEDIGEIVYLSIIDLPLEIKLKEEILSALFDYFGSNEIEFRYIEESDRIEVRNPTLEQIKKIVENFDIIESATCSAFTTVRPGEFNTVEREFGFEILNVDEDLPIVGIIDTGISRDTALSPLIIVDETFTLAGNPLVDHGGRNRLGHGTAVAGLVALGRHNHRNNFEGEVRADAKLLSIKISNSGNGFISELDLIEMLYEVKKRYPEIRLFTLTTCYSCNMSTNEAFSDYTYALDKFAFETDSLLFICTGNNDNCINENSNYDLNYFHGEHTNLSTPADSLNNFIVGAAADNLKDGAFLGIASGREFPALYTRKGHIDLSAIYSSKKNNENYFRPDVIESGGDMGFYNPTTLDWMDEPALTLLSALPHRGIMQDVGTSFAAPLTANLAAKIIKNYPQLTNESVKALIINGASLNFIQFTENVTQLLNRVVGNGVVDESKSLYSSENSATMILEDNIEPGKIKIYPINFPDYLLNDELGKKNGILKVTATLCFKFLPIKNNQLSYNPIHMAFSIFKNQSADDIMKPDKALKSKLRSTLSWSENGRHVAKPLPYANTQKIFLNVNLADLHKEDSTFKLAIHAKVSDQIVGNLPDGYPSEFPFSIVISIEETLKKSTGKLYDQLHAVNHLEVISALDLDTTLETEDLNV